MIVYIRIGVYIRIKYLLIRTQEVLFLVITIRNYIQQGVPCAVYIYSSYNVTARSPVRRKNVSILTYTRRAVLLKPVGISFLITHGISFTIS